MKQFLYQQEADFLLDFLRKEIPWTQVKYYKPDRGYVITPRMSWVCGWHDNETDQIISNDLLIKKNEIPKTLIPLKEVVEEYTKKTYNFMLFAHYRDGNDSITYHSDDERFLDFRSTISSITVGNTRPFLLKNKQTKDVQSFDLDHGDLFVMKNNCQQDYLHSIPKTKKKIYDRYSITFRSSLKEAATVNYYTYNSSPQKIF